MGLVPAPATHWHWPRPHPPPSTSSAGAQTSCCSCLAQTGCCPPAAPTRARPWAGSVFLSPTKPGQPPVLVEHNIFLFGLPRPCVLWGWGWSAGRVRVGWIRCDAVFLAPCSAREGRPDGRRSAAQPAINLERTPLRRPCVWGPAGAGADTQHLIRQHCRLCRLPHHLLPANAAKPHTTAAAWPAAALCCCCDGRALSSTHPCSPRPAPPRWPICASPHFYYAQGVRPCASAHRHELLGTPHSLLYTPTSLPDPSSSPPPP